MYKAMVVLACATNAMSLAYSADAPYRVQSPVPYEDTARVREAVRNECRLEQYLGEQVLKAVESGFPGSTASAEIGADAERGIRLSIASVDANGGGGWSGAKGILVRAELIEQGRAVDKKTFYRSSRGLSGMFSGTCPMLEKGADAIGGDVLKWLKQRATREATAIAAPPAATTTATTTADSAVDQSALAASPSFVLLPLVLAPELAVPQNVQQECDFARFLNDEMDSQMLGRFPTARRAGSKEPPAEGAALRIVLVDVNAPAGGNWSGAKAVTLRVEWLEGGSVKESASFTRKAGHTLGAIRGTCSLLDHAARNLSGDVYRWVLKRSSASSAVQANAAGPASP